MIGTDDASAGDREIMLFTNTRPFCLTGVAADGGLMVRAEALASLVSTAQSYWIHRS